MFFSSCSPYTEPTFKPPFDDVDPEYGLHGYQLHFVLYDTVCKLMSGSNSSLFCSKGNVFITFSYFNDYVLSRSFMIQIKKIQNCHTFHCHKPVHAHIAVYVLSLYLDNPRTLRCIIPTAQICDGLVQLTAINGDDLGQRMLLSGNLALPWRCDALQGMVQVRQSAVGHWHTMKAWTTTSCIFQTFGFDFRMVA